VSVPELNFATAPNNSVGFGSIANSRGSKRAVPPAMPFSSSEEVSHRQTTVWDGSIPHGAFRAELFSPCQESQYFRNLAYGNNGC
jgi:hypothetical protein